MFHKKKYVHICELEYIKCAVNSGLKNPVEGYKLASSWWRDFLYISKSLFIWT